MFYMSPAGEVTSWRIMNRGGLNHLSLLMLYRTYFLHLFFSQTSVAVSVKHSHGGVNSAIQALFRHLLERKLKDCIGFRAGVGGGEERQVDPNEVFIIIIIFSVPISPNQCCSISQAFWWWSWFSHTSPYPAPAGAKAEGSCTQEDGSCAGQEESEEEGKGQEGQSRWI